MSERGFNLTLDDVVEIMKPHSDRIVAEHRADQAAKRLEAANKIIAEQNTALAEAHAALTGLLRIIEAVRFTVRLGPNQVARCEAARAAVAKLEGRAS